MCHFNTRMALQAFSACPAVTLLSLDDMCDRLDSLEGSQPEYLLQVRTNLRKDKEALATWYSDYIPGGVRWVSNRWPARRGILRRMMDIEPSDRMVMEA